MLINIFGLTLGGVLLHFDILAKTAVLGAELQLGAGFWSFSSFGRALQLHRGARVPAQPKML